jgi:hypothetical protein
VRRRFTVQLIAIALGGFFLRLSLAATSGNFQALTDPNYYHLQANLIADGHGFIDPFTWTFLGKHVATAAHPPLYSLVLSVPSVLGMRSELAHRTVGCVIGAATIVVIGLLGREIGTPRVGLFAAGIAAVYPNLWVFDAWGFAESLELLLISLLLLAVYRLSHLPTWRQVIWLGVLSGLLALTRAELLLVVPVLVIPVLLTRRELTVGRRMSLAAVSVLVCAAVIAPWIVRNAMTFNRPVLMSTNGDLLVSYTNCSDVYHGRDIGWYSTACAPRSAFANRLSDEADRMYEARKQGLHYASQHVTRLAGLVVWARAARLWDLYQPVRTARLEKPEGRPQGVSDLGTLAFYAFAAFAVAGVVTFRRRTRKPLWPLLMPIAVATITAAAFAGNVRFRAVAEPSVVVLAAAGIDAMAATRSTKATAT